MRCPGATQSKGSRKPLSFGVWQPWETQIHHALSLVGGGGLNSVPPSKKDRMSGQVKDPPHKWGLVIGRCGKGSHLLEVVGELQILVEQVAKVRDREGMHPVVVGGIPVALLHHQAEPGGGAKAAEGTQPLLHWEAPQTAHYIFLLFFICDPMSENGSLFTEPSPSPQIQSSPSQECLGQWT